MEETFKKIKNWLFAGALLFVFFAVLPATIQAATLYFSPSSGSHAVGTTLSVSIYVSSADQAINAASGVISFPQDKLEVASLSKTGSIVNLWVQEPSFSNADGTANFEGIVLNPGFQGSTGKVAVLNFRTKLTGSASLIFSSGSVLANDGKGTNILTGLGSGQFEISSALVQSPEEALVQIISGLPSAPKIFSPTHPDPEDWYNNSRPKFAWDLLSDITAVRLLYDKNPKSRPTVLYSPAISEKQIEEDIKDGIYYFHAQFGNKAGWSKISHFKFQIDTTPPDAFSIKFINGKEIESPRPTIDFETKDNLSGIDYYKIKIGEGDFFDIKKPETSANVLFTLPFQSSGKRTILVQAFDKAGNSTAAQDEFIIKETAKPQAEEESKFLKISSVILSYLSLAVVSAILVLFLLFILWFSWQKFFGYKRKVEKEVLEAEKALHRAINLLKDDIVQKIKLLERAKLTRKLTEEENKILEQLKKDIDDAERYIQKEIKDIENLG